MTGTEENSSKVNLKPDKKTIVRRIYKLYDEWASSRYAFYCRKGCASCCTQDVTVTAIEGEIIIEYIKTNKTCAVASVLKNSKPAAIQKPRQTTNAFARNCFAGINTPEQDNNNAIKVPCGFLLEDNACNIYPARPFGCRCFASQDDCRKYGKAHQPEELVAINTVTMQIIEHLGQKKPWGNLYDMLLFLWTMHKDKKDSFLCSDEAMCLSKSRLSKAEPIPGFLVLPSEQPAVEGYLNFIFQEKINNYTLEEILNNPF